MLALVLAAATGSMLCWPRGPKEPVYQGKRVGDWWMEALQEGEFDFVRPFSPKLEAYHRTINDLGTNALPWLVSEFTRPPKWRYAFNRWASQHPSIKYRFGGNYERVRMAAIGIGHLGPDAAPALPILARYLDEPQRSCLASSAMGKIGEAALPYLLKTLSDPDVTSRVNSAAALGEMRDKAKPAITHLLRLMTNSEPSVVWAARNAVYQIDPSALTPLGP